MRSTAATLVMGLAIVSSCTSAEPSTTPADPPEPVAPAQPVSTAAPESMPSAPDGRCLEVVDYDAQVKALAVPARDVAAARKVMSTEPSGFSMSRQAQHAQALGREIRDPMPALAVLLVDHEVGDDVAFTMFVIDRDRAAPLVFASMPKSDRNVQFHSFGRFLRLALGGENICWNAIVADAARRTLEAGTNADAAEQALFALGVAGTNADTKLLRRYLASTEPVEFWRTRLANAARAALARLGDTEAITAIRSALEVPVARRIDFARAVELVATLDQAGFSRQRSLAPLVCRHLGTPTPAPDGDLLPPSPGRHAAMALGHIVDGAPLDASTVDVDAWVKRCRVGSL
jgi:hypothetical protein